MAILVSVVRLSAIPALALALLPWRVTRALAAMIVLAGLFDLAITMTASGEPIRVDLVMLLPLVALMDVALGVLAWRRWKAGWARVAAVASLACGVAGLVGMAAVSVNSAQVSSRIERRNQLLFESAFRTAETFRAEFGEVEGADPLIGYFEAAGDRFTRFVSNAAGETRIYFRCGNTECVWASGDRAAMRAPVSGAAYALQLAAEGEGVRVTLRSGGKALAGLDGTLFRRVPPRFSGVPAGSEVESLGVYSYVKREDRARMLVQIWLYRAGGAVWGYYVRTNQWSGTEARFLHATRFEAEAAGNRWRARVSEQESIEFALGGDGLRTEILWLRKPLHSLELARGAVLEDVLFARAPLWSVKAHEEWFECVNTGHFLTWRVP